MCWKRLDYMLKSAKTILNITINITGWGSTSNHIKTSKNRHLAINRIFTLVSNKKCEETVYGQYRTIPPHFLVLVWISYLLCVFHVLWEVGAKRKNVNFRLAWFRLHFSITSWKRSKTPRHMYLHTRHFVHTYSHTYAIHISTHPQCILLLRRLEGRTLII